MPVFLSGLQAGERKKQETSEISFAFLVIHQLGVNDLTLLFPVPKTSAFPLGSAESPSAFTSCCVRLQLCFGLIIPLAEAEETLCGKWHRFVLHFIQHDAGL